MTKWPPPEEALVLPEQGVKLRETYRWRRRREVPALVCRDVMYFDSVSSRLRHVLRRNQKFSLASSANFANVRNMSEFFEIRDVALSASGQALARSSKQGTCAFISSSNSRRLLRQIYHSFE